MKELLLLLLCVTLMFSCGENENDLTRENIKGNVKEIISTTFSAMDAKGDPKEWGLSYKGICKYNEDGNITEATVYNADGELFEKWKSQYDVVGNRTEETHYNANGEVILSLIHI